MLTESGTKLLDFGLAQFQRERANGESAATLTDQAQVVGTLLYMSPEQVEGRDVDPRSDIFSFGAVLYEMLTGQAAFQRQSTAGIVTAVTRDEPKPIGDFVPNVPHDLQGIVARCLRKAREERYGSALDIVNRLEECRSSALERSDAINIRSSGATTLSYLGQLDFLIKSGRAVMFPVYKGTFERGDDLKSDNPNTSSSWRDHVIAWSKDLGRSIDYLKTARKHFPAARQSFFLPTPVLRLGYPFIVGGGPTRRKTCKHTNPHS